MNFKKLIKIIFITFIIGNLFVFSMFNSNYETAIKPSFTPPGFIFGIVWPILYLLMAISLYLVSIKNNTSLKEYTIYFSQLIVNSLWTFIFFGLDKYLFAFWWLILLIILVIAMIIKFYKIDKTSAYLQIPYLLWLIFAGILNYNIYLLNR